MSVEDMLAEYVVVARMVVHPLKTHATRRKRAGLPHTARQHFLHRRLIEEIGEERTKKLIKGTIETLDMLEG